MAAGLSNAEIGGRLGLAEKTVKHYMTAILGKLEVGSRVEAPLLAYKAGVRPGEGDRPGVDLAFRRARRSGPGHPRSPTVSSFCGRPS